MPNDFIDGIGDAYDAGDTDPYIDAAAAEEALREDFPLWADAVENGLADWESAALMAAFDVENPYDVSEVSLNYDGSEWTMSIVEGDEIHEVDLGEDLEFWVWDWLYDMADDFGWDWAIMYGEAE